MICLILDIRAESIFFSFYATELTIVVLFIKKIVTFVLFYLELFCKEKTLCFVNYFDKFVFMQTRFGKTNFT